MSIVHWHVGHLYTTSTATVEHPSRYLLLLLLLPWDTLRATTCGKFHADDASSVINPVHTETHSLLPRHEHRCRNIQTARLKEKGKASVTRPFP